jgi:hypothetical protein
VAPCTAWWLSLFVAFAAGEDDFHTLLDRLRRESPGEYKKVLELPQKTAEEFLRERYGKLAGKGPPVEKRAAEKGAAKAAEKSASPGAKLLPARRERFVVLERLPVGEFTVDLCTRDDGAFGLGEVRRGETLIRRGDFLLTWKVGTEFPSFQARKGTEVTLRGPKSTVSFFPEQRISAGTVFEGFRIRFETEAGRGPIVETSSWELGGSTRDLTYFDGYRGWHAPPAWLEAAAVPETNPKLTPSLLHGTGFQLEHGPEGALVVFHTGEGDRLQNASRGEALEFVTTFDGPPAFDRYVFTLAGLSRINLWSRAFEVAQAEMRRAFALQEPAREIVCVWPPFGRKGFRAMAEDHAALTARQGFTAVYIDVLWDNIEFHGGKKNMNVWDYSVCQGYGGEEGLRALVDECRKHGLRVIAWAPAGHLNAAAPVWKEHPEWVLKSSRGDKALNPSGLFQGDLSTGFAEYFRGRFLGVIREFGLDGLWMDSHLAYAQQYQSSGHGAKLAAIYRDFAQAGAKVLIAEGDASALAAYGVGIGSEWEESWGKFPDPDLYYGATLMSGMTDGRLHRQHFRRYVASGAAWAVSREFLDSPKLRGEEVEAARRDALEVVQDYRKVRERMVHRFVHDDGSGYTWTNDRDETQVVWLLRDAVLPDGREGRAGGVFVVEPVR